MEVVIIYEFVRNYVVVGLLFVIGSDKISFFSYVGFDEIVVFLFCKYDLKIEIVGYIDVEGDDEFN